MTPKKPDRSKRKKGIQEDSTKAKEVCSKSEDIINEKTVKTFILSDSHTNKKNLDKPGNDFEMECHLNLAAMKTDATISEKSINEQFRIRNDVVDKPDIIAEFNQNILQDTDKLLHKMDEMPTSG